MALPRTLTIAGSDSGGGAGIQADLKTFLSMQTYGMSVLTALTAQNTQGVQSIHTPDPAFVRAQFDSIATDVRIDAIKIGMLANAAIVREVIQCIAALQKEHEVPIVLDPVMVSTSGSLLLERDAIGTLISELLPLCALLTPNLPETETILQSAGVTPKATSSVLAKMMASAQSIAQLGIPNVLVKGGHVPITHDDLQEALQDARVSLPLHTDDEAIAGFSDTSVSTSRDVHGTAALSARVERSERSDIAQVLGASAFHAPRLDVFLAHGPNDVRLLRRNLPNVGSTSYTVDVLYESATQHTTVFVKPTISTSATHGTGCTLSSAICAAHAHGHPLRIAVAHGLQFLQEALQSSVEDLGKGPGPLNHGAYVMPRGIPLCTARCGAPLTTKLIARSWHLWHMYTRHPFVARMCDGTLSKAAFVWFMRQDYLYLKHYARVWAAAAADPACSPDDLRDYVTISQASIDEIRLHMAVCERIGIPRDELDRTEESRTTMAYTRYMMDIARQGILPLLVSVASCAFGYAEIGLWLKEQRQRHATPTSALDPSYEAWLDEYGGDGFQDVVRSTLDMFERCAARVMPSLEETEHLQEIWNTATRLEIGMWDEAIAQGERTEGTV
ncbi:trifunctional hydroxymethylpyrimidine kinase/phosphomethylpyrimidine kinase/thiaminase [Malassezia brasiliensis]|uniref:Trifunctional hydroxymethylpyrimidine kinase/phosphomethylpyrimidine kinase/thiaminase n=1 Tax=Malassezia brasiliensis TaxID=1821822 RepID=A0AAF0DVT0_9BASI|nr:trifunctional hydroxymethylpyrimidine kinase/phosphomethylpyrimidine kinase/thiaminase [Malassezia brasiliensis]